MIFDFVDAGLPSTVVEEARFRRAIRPLLQHVGRLAPDVLVAEAGASPLEPYNGTAAIEELGGSISCTVLWASDPYAVVGVQQAFGMEPDIVAGPRSEHVGGNRSRGKLAGTPALNVLDPDSVPQLREILSRTLHL